MPEAATAVLPAVRTRRIIRPITEEVDRVVNEEIRTRTVSINPVRRSEIESVDGNLAAYRLGQAEAARSRSSESRSSGVRYDLIGVILVVVAILGGIWAIGNWSTVVNFAADSFQSLSALKPERVIYEAGDRTTCGEIADIGGTCRSPMPRR